MIYPDKARSARELADDWLRKQTHWLCHDDVDQVECFVAGFDAGAASGQGEIDAMADTAQAYFMDICRLRADLAAMREALVACQSMTSYAFHRLGSFMQPHEIKSFESADLLGSVALATDNPGAKLLEAKRLAVEALEEIVELKFGYLGDSRELSENALAAIRKLEE